MSRFLNFNLRRCRRWEYIAGSIWAGMLHTSCLSSEDIGSYSSPSPSAKIHSGLLREWFESRQTQAFCYKSVSHTIPEYVQEHGEPVPMLGKLATTGPYQFTNRYGNLTAEDVRMAFCRGGCKALKGLRMSPIASLQPTATVQPTTTRTTGMTSCRTVAATEPCPSLLFR